ncbi:restriction endonuclease [Pseudomonas sp. IPO3779]|uniref:restriction endonuclease n=1 Tax=unclassified Pseudomonas TaxID=196821 RepID=UPI00273793C2
MTRPAPRDPESGEGSEAMTGACLTVSQMQSFRGLRHHHLHRCCGFGIFISEIENMVIAALVIGQGGPGDAGIDGIMSLDKLGLGKIYVLAKRWRIMKWALDHNCCDCLHWK